MKILLPIIMLVSMHVFGQPTEDEKQLFLNNSEVISGRIFRMDSTFYFQKEGIYYYVNASEIKYATSSIAIGKYKNPGSLMVSAWDKKRTSVNLQWAALATGVIGGILAGTSESIAPTIIVGTLSVGLLITSLAFNGTGNRMARDATVMKEAEKYFK